MAAALVGVWCITACATAVAQESGQELRISGSTRLRFEAIDGQVRAGFNAEDTLINLRTTVLAEYRSGATRLGVELYDSRAWGDDAGTPLSTNEVNALEPVQFYASTAFTDAFGKGTRLTLTAGRMTLNLGSRRLVAADDYRNTTNGYTGLKADVAAREDWKATLIYMLPQVRLPDDAAGLHEDEVHLDRESRDLVLWGAQVSKGNVFGTTLAELTYFHLDERDAPGRATRDRDLDTVGGRLIAEPRAGSIDYEVEAFVQTGSISASTAASAAPLDVRADFFHADIGYSFRGKSKPRLALEFDRASGDGGGARFGRFDTLFGMRRAEFAPTGLYNAIGRTNILTPGIRFETTPSTRLDWFAGYKALWLAADEDVFSTTGVRDATGQSGDFAGHQFEGRVRYWIVPAHLRFELTGVLLSRRGFLRNAPNATPGAWTKYGSANLTASF